MALSSLQEWLAPLDALPLECDGMSRVISALLSKEGIDHRVWVGRLTVSDQGIIPPHFWITLADGAVCDYRARMWFGNTDNVPHGIFMPDTECNYQAQYELHAPLSPLLFTILTDRSLTDYPALSDFISPDPFLS